MLRIRSVRALGDKVLRLELTDGFVVERDLSGVLEGPVFESVARDPRAFARARVEDGTVAWPGGADLCPDALIWGGPPPSDELARPPARLLVPKQVDAKSTG